MEAFKGEGKKGKITRGTDAALAPESRENSSGRALKTKETRDG